MEFIVVKPTDIFSAKINWPVTTYLLHFRDATQCNLCGRSAHKKRDLRHSKVCPTHPKNLELLNV